MWSHLLNASVSGKNSNSSWGGRQTSGYVCSPVCAAAEAGQGVFNAPQTHRAAPPYLNERFHPELYRQQMNSEVAAGEGSPEQPQLCNMIMWFTDQDTGTRLGLTAMRKQKPVVCWELLLYRWKGKGEKRENRREGRKVCYGQKRVRDRQGAMWPKDPSKRAQKMCLFRENR